MNNDINKFICVWVILFNKLLYNCHIKEWCVNKNHSYSLLSYYQAVRQYKIQLNNIWKNIEKGKKFGLGGRREKKEKSTKVKYKITFCLYWFSNLKRLQVRKNI